ncbi:hypothetical protein OUZ56_027560 [Daphnia magna]|uniref:Uncharacterized protein n=1 Tax=Daphnia magna TaxID=35525 RepID=A0ABR0B1C7_9CRUS|nr:hypothetical protein OUZ56_027560 [Daphnia magna]
MELVNICPYRVHEDEPEKADMTVRLLPSHSVAKAIFSVPCFLEKKPCKLHHRRLTLSQLYIEYPTD